MLLNVSVIQIDRQIVLVLHILEVRHFDCLQYVRDVRNRIRLFVESSSQPHTQRLPLMSLPLAIRVLRLHRGRYVPRRALVVLRTAIGVDANVLEQLTHLSFSLHLHLLGFNVSLLHLVTDFFRDSIQFLLILTHNGLLLQLDQPL